MEPTRAKVLTPAKFRHLLRVTEATSRFPEWLDEARTVLRSDLATLRARREEQFLRLNGLVTSHQIS